MTPVQSRDATKRPRGRPKAAEPVNSSVTAWVRADDHDRLIALARKQDTTVSALVRAVLTKRLGG